MTDADRTDKAEERENMYIMMFTLQSLQNYGLSVKKTVERSLDYLWEWYQESGEERYLLLANHVVCIYMMGLRGLFCFWQNIWTGIRIRHAGKTWKKSINWLLKN